jgi:uncharacterized protein (TIGR03067 family)
MTVHRERQAASGQPARHLMKWKSGLLFVVVLVLGAGGAADDQKKELAKFAGTWNLSELTFSGEEHKLKFNVVFKGNEGVVEGNDDVKREYAKIKFMLDPTAKPKIMDITVAAGSQTDAKMEGIYEFKDGDLRMCVKVFGKDRPTEFASPADSSIVLLVLKKAAP